MKLIIAIIQDEFSQKVVKALMDAKIRATKLSSTGGFLKSGNTTLLIAVEADEVLSVVTLIKKECNETKMVKTKNENLDVKGANIFILNIDSSERI